MPQISISLECQSQPGIANRKLKKSFNMEDAEAAEDSTRLNEHSRNV
jgi:hypothetical protein